jgi:hypothetical protein
MRFETIAASHYLVNRLEYAHVVKDMRDEGDIIIVTLHNDEQIMIVLVERGMSLEEIQRFFSTNTEKGLYTLMLFWVDMLLPRDGQVTQLEDWLSVLAGLHGGKIYGYEVAAREAFFFPVYLQGEGNERRVRYGNIVNYAAIGGKVVGSLHPHMPGEWRVGNFENTEQAYRDHTATEAARRVHALAIYYDILGIPHDAEEDVVKRAYHTLARLYHPDVADTPDDVRMKRINDAYQRIMKHLTE